MYRGISVSPVLSTVSPATWTSVSSANQGYNITKAFVSAPAPMGSLPSTAFVPLALPLEIV